MKRLYAFGATAMALVLSGCVQFGQPGSELAASQEAQAFLAAIRANSAEGYQAFLRSYPNGQFAAQARTFEVECRRIVCPDNDSIQESILLARVTASGPARNTSGVSQVSPAY